MVVASALCPTMEEVYEGRERLKDIAVRTPLLQLHGSDDIWIKPEVLQPVGSFKMRGIYNAVAALHPDERAKGVSTVSSGNTAQALSWSARKFGVTARAIMPHTAPQNKIDATIAYGGVPDLRDPEEAFQSLLDGSYHNEPDAFIHPVANRDVLAGHGSIGLEIHEDLPDVQTVYVPVGGGGLSCGIANAIKNLSPGVRVIGVQPAECTPVIQGVKAGEPVMVKCVTFCDGVAVSFMFPEMYPLMRDLLDDIITVEEEDVFEALRLLAMKNKIVAEGAGGLSVAAALKAKPGERGKTVAIISGGSIDPDKLARILVGDTP
ncbi:threonine/serine dehydratase [soil metagenome]